MYRKSKFYIVTILLTLISIKGVVISIENFEKEIGYYCLADLFTQYCSPLLIGFFILPVMMLFISSLNKQYENPCAILSFGSRENIYKSRMKNSLIVIFKFITVLTLTLFIYCKLRFPELPLINWNSTESFFCDIANGTIDIGFQWILFLFLSGLFFSSLVISFLMLIITELTNSKAYAWVVFLMLMVNELFFPKFAILVGHCLLKYDFMINQMLIIKYILIASLEISIFNFLGKSAFLKKDFL